MKMKTLTEAEEEIMIKIWETGFPVTSSMLLSAFHETKRWKSQTINTFLTRLVDKNYLSVEKRGVTNHYTALVTKDEFEQHSTKDLIEKMYGGSLKRLIASLVESNSVSQADLTEIRDWFNTMYKE